jgi:hypothetical protein
VFVTLHRLVDFICYLQVNFFSKEITNLGKHWILSILPLCKGLDKLMSLHINNLLNAISKDSSNFLEIKGESILLRIFLKRLKKNSPVDSKRPLHKGRIDKIQCLPKLVISLSLVLTGLSP